MVINCIFYLCISVLYAMRNKSYYYVIDTSMHCNVLAKNSFFCAKKSFLHQKTHFFWDHIDVINNFLQGCVGVREKIIGTWFPFL